MMLLVKEWAFLSFDGLTEVIPIMARALVASTEQCIGNSAGISMLLAGWDAEKDKMRVVCWEIRDTKNTEVVEAEPVPAGVQVLVRGSQKAQETAQRLIMQSTKGVPNCFPTVFSQTADICQEVGRILHWNTVTRPHNSKAARNDIPFAHDTTGTGSGAKISWTSITGYKPFGATFVIPSSTDPSQIATVPLPTLSTVVGGSKGARTYFVRLAFGIDGGLRGFGANASISVPANSLLKIISPANTPPWSFYSPFISTASGIELLENSISSGTLSFGVDWIEPTGALSQPGPDQPALTPGVLTKCG